MQGDATATGQDQGLKTVTIAELRDAFLAAGCRAGDVLMLHADISRIGRIDGAAGRAAVLDGYLAAAGEALGPDGTLVMLASTEAYGRGEVPYVHEETPTRQGVLAEHLRTRQGTIRSMHPLFSLAARGAKAERICGADVAPTGFGWDSPFHRLKAEDAMIGCLGIDLKAMTFVHHVEQMFGVPYGYTKEWQGAVDRGGARDDRRYFAFVRYLSAGVSYDFTRLIERLSANGAVRSVAVGHGSLWAVRARDVFETGIAELKRDPFCFLSEPPHAEPWKS